MDTNTEKQATQITEEQLEALKKEQNLGAAIGAGFGISIVMAILWAVITVVTEYQIGYMAIAVGFAVGFATRFAGKGIDTIFGISGAFFALLGCILGDLFGLIGFAAIQEGLGYFETLLLVDYAVMIDIMIENTDIMSFIFYALAIYQGYRFSFRVQEEEEEEEVSESAI